MIVTDKEGNELFVEARRSGIHAIALHTDGLRLVFFGKSEGPYIRAEDVAEWHDCESQRRGAKTQFHTQVRDAVRSGIEKFQAGEITFN